MPAEAPNGIPYMKQVIPAKAGTQYMHPAFLKVREVDSRFRGNDIELGTPSLANATIPNFSRRSHANLIFLR